MTEIPFELKRIDLFVPGPDGKIGPAEHPKLLLRLDGNLVKIVAQDPADRRLDRFCEKNPLSKYSRYLEASGITADAPEEEIARFLARGIGAPVH